MKHVVGTCGHCGGAVCKPALWMGINPPPATCASCGRCAKESHGPTIEMERPNQHVQPDIAKILNGIRQ